MEKSAGTGRELITRACIAGLIGAGLLLVLTLGFACLRIHVPLTEGKETILERILLILSSFLAGRLAIGKRGEQRLLRAGISCLTLTVFLLILAAISENSSVLNISILFDLLCIISGGFCACLHRKSRTGRRKKHR